MKILLLKPLGPTESKGDEGLYVAGDQLGRYDVVEILGTFADEASARARCLQIFFARLDKRNREQVARDQSSGVAHLSAQHDKSTRHSRAA